MKHNHCLMMIFTMLLVTAASSESYVDDWDVEICCDGICMDLNGSLTVDEEDFLLVVACCGRDTGLMNDDGHPSLSCVEAGFSHNGYIDLYDIYAWDWALKETYRINGPGCWMSLGRPETTEAIGEPNDDPDYLPAVSPEGIEPNALPGDMLVLGKGRMTSTYVFQEILEDGLYLFDTCQAFLVGLAGLDLPNRCNVRLVNGPESSLFLINTERGVLQISESIETVLGPMQLTYTSDRRSQGPATVYVGIQGDSCESFGRPILDVAFDDQGAVYVIPVVVEPNSGEPYVAAAKLARPDSSDISYHLTQLFDDPPAAEDNQYQDYLREIEIDAQGNVYLLNAHALNENCIVWKYASDGTMLKRLDLLSPDSPVKIADPMAMHVSQDGQTLYLASGQCNLQGPANSTIHKLSTTDLSSVGTITIRNMRQVTAITEDPGTGALWITGFNMPEIPAIPDVTAEPFYIPAIAQLPAGAETAQAVDIADLTQHNLALPTSIVWIGAEQ